MRLKIFSTAKVKHWSSVNKLRRFLAVLFVSSMLGLLIALINDSYRESRLDYWLHFSNPYAVPGFLMRFNNINPDQMSANLSVSIIQPNDLHLILVLDKAPEKAMFLPKNATDADEKQNLKAYFGPIEVSDSSESFQRIGLLGARKFRQILSPEDAAHTDLQQVRTATTDLKLVGDPALYPFDTYLIIGAVHVDAFLRWGETKRFIPIEEPSYSVDSPITGFILERAPAEYLESFPTYISSMLPKEKLMKYDPKYFTEEGFAVIAHRPLFLRVVIPFIGLVALGSSILILCTADSKQFSITAVAYFFGLWAIKSALAVGSPSTPTMVDYGVLTLFTLTVIFMVARVIWGFEPRKDIPNPGASRDRT